MANRPSLWPDPPQLPARGCPRCAHYSEVWHRYIDTNGKEVRIYRCKNCRLRWTEEEES